MSSASTKRLLKEVASLHATPSPHFLASPLDNDLFHWHFTLSGPAESSFEGGKYHGRILFPREYPMKPPDIIFLTPNGRFVVGKKICLSITGKKSENL
jgi:ubiquitin-conjugating enzyme E2 J1